MATPSISQTDSPDNTPIADADVLAWADILCQARDGIERAFVYEEDVSLKFHRAMYLHIEYCNTLDEVEQSAAAIRSMMERWAHRMDIDDAVLDSLVKKAIVRVLRAMPYDEYLKTDHWMATRIGALERAGHRCQLCNSNERLQTHHRSYERRGHEQPEDLIVLCADCHKTFHENGRLAS
jgi:HAMP domain-containing protein